MGTARKLAGGIVALGTRNWDLRSTLFYAMHFVLISLGRYWYRDWRIFFYCKERSTFISSITSLRSDASTKPFLCYKNQSQQNINQHQHPVFYPWSRASSAGDGITVANNVERSECPINHKWTMLLSTLSYFLKQFTNCFRNTSASAAIHMTTGHSWTPKHVATKQSHHPHFRMACTSPKFFQGLFSYFLESAMV